MAIRKAQAVWEGKLREGHGTITLGENGLQAQYGYYSRFQEHAPGTNPEELLGGAHAGCFSMALAHELEAAGHPPSHIETVAQVHFVKGRDGFSISKIELETTVDASGIEEADFLKVANLAKDNCPVSRLFQGAEITLNAHLLSLQKT
jgi:osmotically inducible protein OsmC